VYQVWLPAIEGYVPVEMMRTIRALLEFCYIARRDVIDTQSPQTKLSSAEQWSFSIFLLMIIKNAVRNRIAEPILTHQTRPLPLTVGLLPSR